MRISACALGCRQITGSPYGSTARCRHRDGCYEGFDGRQLQCPLTWSPVSPHVYTMIGRLRAIESQPTLNMRGVWHATQQRSLCLAILVAASSFPSTPPLQLARLRVGRRLCSAMKAAFGWSHRSLWPHKVRVGLEKFGSRSIATQHVKQAKIVCIPRRSFIACFAEVSE